jgi:hypothetical protein
VRKWKKQKKDKDTDTQRSKSRKLERERERGERAAKKKKSARLGALFQSKGGGRIMRKRARDTINQYNQSKGSIPHTTFGRIGGSFD